jgi:hypothetical protein
MRASNQQHHGNKFLLLNGSALDQPFVCRYKKNKEKEGIEI